MVGGSTGHQQRRLSLELRSENRVNSSSIVQILFPFVYRIRENKYEKLLLDCLLY